MSIGRRRFLQSALIAPPLLAGLSRLAQSQGLGRPLLLVCDGLSAGTDPRSLQAFLEPFGAQRIKLGLVFDAGTGAAALAAGAQAHPDFVEWIADQPSILDDLPYFQMRQANAAQHSFDGLRARWGNGLTVSCPEPAGAVPALNGIRAAGFRNVLLRPAADRNVECWTTENGVLQVLGGRRIGLAALDPVFAALSEPGGLADPLLVYLGLDDLSGFSAATLKTIADTLSDAIATAMYDGLVRPMAPSDFHLAGFDAARLLALHFELAGASDAALPPVLQRLAERGVPFSLSGAAIGAASIPATWQGVTACIALDGAPPASGWEELRSRLSGALSGSGLSAPEACVLVEAPAPDLLRTIAATGATAVTPTAANVSPALGLDDAGLLHIPAALTLDAADAASAVPSASAGLTRGTGRLRDALILVRLGTTGTGDAPGFEEWLPKLLAGQGSAAGLPGLARGIMPADPLFALLKRSAVEAFVAGAESDAIDAAERERLMADAGLAWRYFSRLSDPRSGLAYSAVQTDGQNLTTYPLVTMWEIGSQILATIAALRIGIIDRSAFSGRIARLLRSIPATRVGGLMLPPANVSVNRAPQAADSFSASDTGRLLTALNILAREFDMEKTVAAVVGRWDLAKATAERHLHNVAGGRLKEYSNSNYVDYAARGFAAFGFDTISPYDIGTAEAGMDRDMRLLSRIADLGPIATEPHVIEALETGYSEASRLIAKVLFTAQLGAHEATGQLFCVSETALDRDPWFSYQGFRLGARDEPWSVETTLGSAEFPTEASRAALRLLNTKAAYAWAAVRPHAYSRKLLAAVRAAARIPDLGFAAGIYMDTGKVTRNFSDTNTNAVILEAIAYILSGRRPLLTSS